MQAEKTDRFSKNIVPWQIWVVVVLLSLEGISNLLMIFDEPKAIIWLAAKVIFILGLLKRWRLVYFIFLVVAAFHVIVFAATGAIFVSIINLVLIILTLWAFRFYFPGESTNTTNESQII